MRSRFRRNRILERQSSENRHAGLKFLRKRENSAFWPNLIFERQSSQNRETGLKFSSKRKNSALFMKIVQHALFRLCAAGFGEIAF